MITEKRNDLERFVREQTLGPGILGFRFVDIQNNELFAQDLKKTFPIHYTNELINNAPGALYSTGILFPVDSSKTAILEADPDTSEESDIQGTHESISEDIEEEESLNINQMYPNYMGLTCCLNGSIENFDNVRICVRARYYIKLKRNELLEKHGVLLEADVNSFKAFITSLDENDIIKKKIRIRELKQNTVLQIASIEQDEVGLLKARLKEIDRIKAKELGSDKDGQYLSGYKEYLYRELKYNAIEKGKQELIVSKINNIEIVENCISHITDLINIFDSRGYGLWKCQIIEKDILIPLEVPNNIFGKKVLSYQKYNQLKDIFRFDINDSERASLSLNIQFSRNSKKKEANLYLKVQLVNTSTEFTIPEGDSRYYSVFNEIVNQRAFFGVNLSIQSPHLIPYRNVDLLPSKTEFNEDEVTEVLYDQFKDFAVGHGCSVKWDINNSYVESEYIPSTDIPDVDPTPRLKNSIININGTYEPEMVFKESRFLQFKWLSTFSNASNDDIIAGLKTFVGAYENWIEQKRNYYSSNKFHSIAEQELKKCDADRKRILSNINDLLSGSENAENLLSFRLMNSAMFMQLWHSVNVKNETIEQFLKRDQFTSFDEEFYSKMNDELFEKGFSATWRPFQLAFILLNLDGIFQGKRDIEWTYRNNLVDLVWFPTGGGKTEAYLGIIALTIINRRKRYKENGGGTAVLMRYTLRLLTLQQFQRATLIIMAMELIRRWGKYNLGEEPIYIGMWVGKGSLPNTSADLLEEYDKIRANQSNQNKSSSRIPFEKCPWCGYDLNPISYEKIQDSSLIYRYNRVELKCSRPDHVCSFSMPMRQKLRRKDHGPIPVSLCDEEIYQHPPTLIFGTVDKFAQLAHVVSEKPENRHKDTRRIFGIGNWEQGKPKNGYLTPDLIIQDELHLLLGPLGSSVALFESAIDQLCSRRENEIMLRPKVISSTATTRNTELQIMALFNRKLNIFPKPGVECDDSFFAFYKRKFNNDSRLPIYLSKRKYFGIMPTGRTQMWMQMRLSAILMVHRAIFEARELEKNNLTVISDYPEKLRQTMDNYHTILTYFNSLREVGKTESQISTYIIKEIRRVFNRVLRPGKIMHSIYTYSLTSGELTGRLSGEEVKKELDRVSSKWRSGDRFAHVENNIKSTGYAPPDLVVTTNMISVGIDVSRFNTIIINSMPRNLAEYIQATSRVARSTSGAVFTVHHPFRSRDISHYEKFIEFHEKMYSYVEPISITPFTKKAINRYFGLYLATMLRHRTQFVGRRTASQIINLTEDKLSSLHSYLIQYFQHREKDLSNMQVDDIIKNLLKEENIVDIKNMLEVAFEEWKKRAIKISSDGGQLVFNKKALKANPFQEQLYVDIDEYEMNIHSRVWQIPQSLRVIEPEAVIKIKSR